MRTKAEDKEQLKIEILKDSVKTFKKFGKAGAPVDQIMKKAGLTSGALYSHFKGKDDLFHQAVMFDFDNLIIRYGDLVRREGTEGLKKIVNEYLSFAHVKNSEQGCLVTSLSADMCRGKSSEKNDFETRHKKILEIYTEGISRGTKAEKLQAATIMTTLMVGTMSVARSLKSDEQIIETLEAAKTQIFKMIG